MKELFYFVLVAPHVVIFIGLMLCTIDYIGMLCDKLSLFFKLSLRIRKYRILNKRHSKHTDYYLVKMHLCKQERKNIFSIEDLKFWKAFI